MSDSPNISPAETEVANGQQESTVLTGAASSDTSQTDEGTGASETDPATEGGGKVDDGKAGDDAGDDAGEDNQKPIDDYSDFTLPEGIELDTATLEKAVPIFKELGLNQEQAQKLVDFQASMVQENLDSQQDAFAELKSTWMTESENDKDFGGEAFNENVGIARLAMDKLGSEGLTQLMDDYGVGNHPEVIRFMWNVGKLIKEDVPGQQGNASTESKDRVSVMYPRS